MKYDIIQTDSSFCPNCEQCVLLLSEEDGEGPAFYLCRSCGFVGHVGRRKLFDGIKVTTGPWDDGSTAVFTPYIDHETNAVGFRCEVNGATTYIFLNPSTGGASPDVFLYQNESGSPADDGAIIFAGFPPGPDAEEST